MYATHKIPNRQAAKYCRVNSITNRISITTSDCYYVISRSLNTDF